MTQDRRVKSAAAVVALLVMAAVSLAGQNGGAANPFREDANWAKLPAGAKWAGVISVDPASNGDIWVFHRSDPPILRFDPSGKVVKSFGQGLIVQAHGMTIDRDGNVWVTDAQIKDGKGNQVLKFSPDGKLLMALGKAGVAGAGTDVFSGPCDVAIAQNGDIFVADRSNSRVQIFDQDGKFLEQWKQFGRPSGIYIDRNDNMAVADSQSNAKQNPGYTRGIRVGSAKDGKVTALIPFVEPDPEKNNNAGVEGVAIDARGNVYGAEVSTEALKKYVKGTSTF